MAPATASDATNRIFPRTPTKRRASYTRSADGAVNSPGDLGTRQPGEVADGAIAHVDRGVGVRARGRVGVRDRDPPVAAAGDVAGKRPVRPERVPRSRVLVRVPVRPSVDGDRLDVLGGVEPAR